VRVESTNTTPLLRQDIDFPVKAGVDTLLLDRLPQDYSKPYFISAFVALFSFCSGTPRSIRKNIYLGRRMISDLDVRQPRI
jgi:hypothetical protein